MKRNLSLSKEKEVWLLTIRLLPGSPDLFVGRVRQLERIRHLFCTKKILFIEGISGIGKTSIALVLANSLNKEYPGRVFWITCQEGWQTDSFINDIVNCLLIQKINDTFLIIHLPINNKCLFTVFK